MLKTCGTCQLYVREQLTCQLMPGLQGCIKPEDYCSQHKDEILLCELCGSGLLDVFVRVDEGGQAHTYCGQCIS